MSREKKQKKRAPGKNTRADAMGGSAVAVTHLGLVGLARDDKDESVVVLNLLHGSLCGQRHEGGRRDAQGKFVWRTLQNVAAGRQQKRAAGRGPAPVIWTAGARKWPVAHNAPVVRGLTMMLCLSRPRLRSVERRGYLGFRGSSSVFGLRGSGTVGVSA